MKLIVLTKQFGNYTGATVSTIQLLKRINKYFDEILVFTTKTDGTQIPNVKFKIAKINKLKKAMCKLDTNEYIGYSDDHYGYLFKKANIKYIHTYHGNWPDARWLSWAMFAKSFYFISLYKKTIKYSAKTISVSKYMLNKFVKKYTSSYDTIYNGIKQINQHNKGTRKDKKSFIMVGNIDKRKYGQAMPIFGLLNNNINIDIYGKVIDKRLAEKLNRYPFVNLMGMKESIDYNKYTIFLCTSKSENLPVSIVEAIKRGLPVIAYDTGGISEVVKNNENGYVIKNGESRAFKKAILEAVNMKIKEPKIVNQFNWDYASKKYMRVFKKYECNTEK